MGNVYTNYYPLSYWKLRYTMKFKRKGERIEKEPYERVNKMWWNTVMQLSLQRSFKLILKIQQVWCTPSVHKSPGSTQGLVKRAPWCTPIIPEKRSLNHLALNSLHRQLFKHRV